ncbi:MAG: hypothetical protein LBQ34_03235 [Alphaproteobacteria bacterium]|jgi:hypothetical protein|nr:hypothetical protein [Alphaproteobacteria bacterium]
MAKQKFIIILLTITFIFIGTILKAEITERKNGIQVEYNSGTNTTTVTNMNNKKASVCLSDGSGGKIKPFNAGDIQSFKGRYRLCS